MNANFWTTVVPLNRTIRLASAGDNALRITVTKLAAGTVLVSFLAPIVFGGEVPQAGEFIHVPNEGATLIAAPGQVLYGVADVAPIPVSLEIVGIHSLDDASSLLL